MDIDDVSAVLIDVCDELGSGRDIECYSTLAALLLDASNELKSIIRARDNAECYEEDRAEHARERDAEAREINRRG